MRRCQGRGIDLLNKPELKGDMLVAESGANIRYQERYDA